MVLSMVSSHALLHQATRDRNESGEIIATLLDYEEVRLLVGDLLSAIARGYIRKAV